MSEICIECGQRERFKHDLFCEVCRAKAYGIKEPTKPECRCNCGYTCGRNCGLEIMECMEQHWKKDCDHSWDGPQQEFADGRGFSTTCSKCGITAMDHDCAVGP
jgi:hypothetical protein